MTLDLYIKARATALCPLLKVREEYVSLQARLNHISGQLGSQNVTVSFPGRSPWDVKQMIVAKIAELQLVPQPPTEPEEPIRQTRSSSPILGGVRTPSPTSPNGPIQQPRSSSHGSLRQPSSPVQAPGRSSKPRQRQKLTPDLAEDEYEIPETPKARGRLVKRSAPAPSSSSRLKQRQEPEIIPISSGADDTTDTDTDDHEADAEVEGTGWYDAPTTRRRNAPRAANRVQDIQKHAAAGIRGAKARLRAVSKLSV